MINGLFSDPNPDVDFSDGKLLVAAPLNYYGFLQRSVQLIIDATEQALITIILGRLTDRPLAEGVDEWSELAGNPKAYFQGGVHEPQGVLALATRGPQADTSPIQWFSALPSVGLVALESGVDEVREAIGQMRFFLGYNALPTDQVREGIAAGNWRLVSGLTDDVFAPVTADVWGSVLRRMPSPAPLWATYPSSGEN
ncbi:MAG: YqgE/AlgH family protein [Corynebacterium sp.]|nr:YqgE/AlgH family protein [Corynebacterium sp.]